MKQSELGEPFPGPASMAEAKFGPSLLGRGLRLLLQMVLVRISTPLCIATAY